MPPESMMPSGKPMWAPNFIEALDKAVRSGIKVHERADLVDPFFHIFTLEDPESKLNVSFRLNESILYINNNPELLHTIAEIEKFIDDCEKHSLFVKAMLSPSMFLSLGEATKLSTHVSCPVILHDSHGTEIKVQPEFVAIWQNICNNVDKELKSRGEFVIDYAKLTDVLIQLGIALPKDEEN